MTILSHALTGSGVGLFFGWPAGLAAAAGGVAADLAERPLGLRHRLDTHILEIRILWIPLLLWTFLVGWAWRWWLAAFAAGDVLHLLLDAGSWTGIPSLLAGRRLKIRLGGSPIYATGDGREMGIASAIFALAAAAWWVR